MIAALSYTVEGETGSTVTKLSYCFQISTQKKKGTGTMGNWLRKQGQKTDLCGLSSGLTSIPFNFIKLCPGF